MKIIFYYPSFILGGAELLFYRLAQSLVAAGYEVAYVDFKDGYVSKLISTEDIKIQLIEYKYNPLTDFNREDVVVMPANFARVINRYVHSSECSLFFWVIHPKNLIPQVSYLKKLIGENSFLYNFTADHLLYKDRQKIKSMVTLFENYNAIKFMDGSCYLQHQQALGLRTTMPDFLPIYLPREAVVGLESRKKGNINKLRLAWLGRIDLSFKHFILERLIKDLNDIREEYRFEFVIIGNGAGTDYIREVINKCTSIQITIISEIEPKKLHNYLKKNIDLVFAMGTSALEGAICKIPTVCLDASYEKVFPGYKYRFIHESQYISLGYIINKRWTPPENKHDMRSILQKVSSDSGYLAEKSFDFYEENYSPKLVLEKFINFICTTSLRLTHIPQEVLEPSWPVKVWRSFRR